MDRKRVGNYEILDKLGAGGMGEVWRARDSRLNRTIAVKILPADVANDPLRRMRFEQEARSLAALNHPNIVAVYDAGQDEGIVYLASELVDGESLRAVIDRGRLPLRRLIDIAVQIADALAAAHAAGIVHRDLKPENVMLTPSGRVKVLDFGLAKQTVPSASENTATIALSQPGTVLGTAGYMSPEQVRGEAIDYRSDIFSFGSVLYELATGKRAFAAPSSVETMNAVLNSDPPEFDDTQAPVPPALAGIIRRCLEKRPDQRFQSAADLAFALRAISLSTSGTQSAIIAAPARSSRSWVRAVIAAASAVVLFAAGFLLRDRTAHREPPRFQRITFRQGLVTNARFTADGRNVVYSANWEGNPARIYLATPGNPESRDLEMPNGSILLSVSSKGDVLSLMGPFDPWGAGTLARSSISGGLMRPWLEDVWAADWAPDGSSVALVRAVNGKFRLEYPLGTVLIDNMSFGPFGVRVSPDGQHIAYATYHNGSAIELFVVDKTGKPQSLGVVSGQTAAVVDPFLAWSPSGREVWFRSFNLTEWGTIYGVDMKGSRRVVTRVPGHVTVYDVARDGRILFRIDTRQEGILGARGSNAQRDLSALDTCTLKGISDDGTMIAATVAGESAGPRGSIYIRKTDGSAPVRLGDGVAFGLLPDGKWVSGYTPKDDGTRRYVLMPTGAGEERTVAIPALKNNNIVFGMAADGRTYFVQGPSQNGVGWQDFAWDPQTGSLRPITPLGVADRYPFVSPDRQSLLTMGPDGQWTVYPVSGGAPVIVKGLSHHDIVVGWKSDNRSVFVIMHHDENKTMEVSVVDIATGQRTPWKEIRPERPVDRVYNLHITPDGQAYAYNFLVKLSDLYVGDGIR